MRGIYYIKNIKNEKIYIGESEDILRRWKEHKEDLNNNKHHSYKLQNDWNEYGADNFEFRIVSVLDKSISTYIDKYILLIYEDYYIKQYDSVENGYNIEHTLEKVLNDKKIIFSDKDKGILKKCNKRIDKKEIIEYGGIIYLNDISTFKDLCTKLEKSNRTVKNLMLQKCIIIKNEGDKYSLADDYKNGDIILNNHSKLSNIKFFSEGFELVYNELIKEDDKIKKETNKSIKSGSKLLNKSTNDKDSMKDFLSNYDLNVKYNDVFKFLREKQIFTYITMEGGRNNNCPTDKYKNWFTCEEKKSSKGNTYISLHITDEGKSKLPQILLDNNIIS